MAAGQNLTLDTVTLTGFMDEQYARDWAFSRTIRINTSRTGAAAPGDVLDFPLLIELDSAFAFADAESNGEDIRFAKSDGTRLRYEIEHWDATNRRAAIWVAMDTVRGGDTTQTFTMYWGRPGAHDYSRGAHVFPTPFVAVWHFGRAPADANAHICHDATGNGHNAVSDGTLTLAPGAVGLAGSFGADTADALHASAPDDALDIDTEALTLSLWLYLDRGLAEQLPVAKGFPLAGYALVCTPDSCYARATDSEGTVFPARLGPEADFIGAWKHVGIVVNVPSGAIMTYVDGAYAGRAVLPPTSSCTTPEPLVLGATLWGLLDEVRVEHAARNADWMKLSYENQRSGQSLLHFE